tara:strand:+ start:27 stop:455 length:429 start_codon:yes stop_codon:yes gene_type:complete
MNNSKVNFQIVTNSEQTISLLYELLAKRKHKISHKEMPNYDDHRKFVSNHPYRYWYIIKTTNIPIGSFYIKSDNSVGINIIDESKEIIECIINFINANIEPNPSVKSMIPDYFFVNIPSTNINLINIFENLNKKSIQSSYQI